MSQQAANVVDFSAYRARRHQYSPPTVNPYAMMPGGSFFAMPVLLPVMIGWLPVWMASVAVAGGAADE
jgi:hypothetical protein